MEGRRAQFVAEVRASEGVAERRAETIVSQAIDRWVWYAGWTDKLAQVLGGLNPVAGPYFDISAPEPTGVVAVLAPQRSSLLGLVSVLAPVVCSGNTAVVLTSELRPLPAITLSEALATSDVPGGVINLITGRTAEVAPWLASHRDVNAIDLTGAADAEGVELGRPRAGRSGEPQARRPTRRRGFRRGRARLVAHSGPRPDHVVPRDQDGLAPQGSLTLDPGTRPFEVNAPEDSGAFTSNRRREGGMTTTTARVVVLAGPSGAGKSRLAARLQGAHGWPIVRLDDFYRDEDDPAMPRSEELGIVDWDHPDSWNRQAALDALSTLVATGEVRTPVYDISLSRAVDTTTVRADPHDLVLAEGIFAAEIIADLRERGLLAGAYCVHHHRGGHLRLAAAARPVRAPQAAAGPWCAAAWR